jgi:hypothetical protein
MSEAQNDQERPCLHCMMAELIDDFFAEYPTALSESDKVDTGEADEVIDAVAKIVAELTSRQDGAIRQQMIEQLMGEIMKYDGLSRKALRDVDAPFPAETRRIITLGRFCANRFMQLSALHP